MLGGIVQHLDAVLLQLLGETSPTATMFWLLSVVRQVLRVS